jgi:hypothetical protein
MRRLTLLTRRQQSALNASAVVCFALSVLPPADSGRVMVDVQPVPCLTTPCAAGNTVSQFQAHFSRRLMQIVGMVAPCNMNHPTRAPRPVLVAPLQVGNVQLKKPLILAPMAGLTSAPFRLICQEYGAAMWTSEMMIASTLLERRPAALGLARWADGALQFISHDFEHCLIFHGALKPPFPLVFSPMHERRRYS